MEALSSQDDVDGVGVCDGFFALEDINKQQQQLDTTTANTSPIATLPTKTKIQGKRTRHTHHQKIGRYLSS